MAKAKFAIMASELKSLKKSMEDRKLAELKKEIIEILKKQDEKDFKKAIDYFESQELHFTHLEKSLVSGKWIEKAGYGIGTVRIWKGKKYKKIAPGKWARVFDKEGRGTNIAIGKLIARVNKIDNAEDLLQFVMENKQRFIDEDGRELGILDKVRAAVDTRNEKLSGESSPYVYGVGENVNRAKNEMFSKKDKIKKEEADLHKVSRKLSQIPTTELKQEKARLERAVANKTRSKRDSLNNVIFRESNQEKLDAINKELEKRSPVKAEKTVEDKIKENPDYPFKPKTEKERAERAAFEKDRDDFIERMDKIRQENKKKDSESAEKTGEVDDYKKQLEDVVKEELVNQKEDIENLYTIKEHGLSGKYAAGLGLTKKDKETSIEDRIQEAAEWLVEHPKGNPKSIGKMLARVELAKEYEKNPDWRYGKKEESEAEKHQNRSDAMKGNQNAKKYGLTDEQIERYDIQEVVEDVNGYGIVKNSEGKYSYIDDGRVKDRPDDFETSIEKVKERINDTYETKKNIQAAKDYDFKNAKLGSDIEYTKRSDGKHLYFKKSPDGSKAISVTVEVSDMREPLNMTYEVSDTKSGKSWQYETAYGNKEGLEWAVEKPEQMEKELKKFFKRDPNKEWEKQNTFEKEPSGIGTFTKVGDKVVETPANKTTKQLFDNLNKSRSTDNTREFMTDCYYDGENIVSTDGLRMTVIKAENLGLEPGYVSINTDGGKIRVESIEKTGLRTSFPNYKGVMPTKNNQEVKLNNKALKEKLAEMKKEGKYSDNKSPKIALNFEDGKVILDGVTVGTADGVKFNDSYQKIVVNAKFLKEALTSGDISSMFVSDNPNKAIVIKTDISDAVVMPFRNEIEVDYENGKTSANNPSEKLDIKSMSNDELKEYEAKLEKELLEMGNRNSPDYMKKYSEWREVHAENNDRFHQGIEDEARAEKQAEADAKSAKEKEIKEKYHGYFDSRSGLDKARDLKTLEKKYNFDGKVMSSKEFVEQAMDNGVEIKEREVNKLDYPSRTRWNRMNGYEQDEYEKRIKAAGKKTVYSINGFEFPKTVVDYAKFYKENGKSKTGSEKPSKSEIAIKNKASSLAGAFGYSKNYATKMGAPFNLELAEQTVDEELDWDDGSKKALKEELRRIYSEKKVQKSLFDDYIMDVFEADEEEEIEDAIKADETEYNDYSAEQSELFNSTAMKVREALDRISNIL